MNISKKCSILNTQFSILNSISLLEVFSEIKIPPGWAAFNGCSFGVYENGKSSK